MSSASPKVGRATPADFLAIPVDTRRHELIDGDLLPKASPSPEHGRSQAALSGSLYARFSRRTGGPPERPGGWWIVTEVEVFLGENVYRPDVVGWRRERAADLPMGSPVTLRPDWICEVVSQPNASRDTVTKMQAYHRAEVPHYWLVDTQHETLTVLRYTPEGYLHVLGARREESVHAEPFDAVELRVGVLFGDDET